MKTLSIIIPLFNEEKTIQEVIKNIFLVNLPNNIKKEIIVVDDGSTDTSKLQVERLKLKGVKLICHKKNLGKGAAIRSALKLSTGDFIIIQDADLEYNPKEYIRLLEPILLAN